MFCKNEGVAVETPFGTLIASYNGSEENPGINIELRVEGEENHIITAVEARKHDEGFILVTDVWTSLWDLCPQETFEVFVAFKL